MASAYLRSWYCFVPSGTSFRGLKVRVLPLRAGSDIDQYHVSAQLTGRRKKTCCPGEDECADCNWKGCKVRPEGYKQRWWWQVAARRLIGRVARLTETYIDRYLDLLSVKPL